MFRLIIKMRALWLVRFESHLDTIMSCELIITGAQHFKMAALHLVNNSVKIINAIEENSVAMGPKYVTELGGTPCKRDMWSFCWVISSIATKKSQSFFLVNRVYDKTRKLMSNSIKTINRRTRGENCWIIPLGLLLKDYSITFTLPSANSFFLVELLISFQTIEIVLTVVVIIIILIIKNFF